MKKKSSVVSVIIVFLNEERFLVEAIESVLMQTYEHWHVLLVDDGSTDGSTGIAKKYALQFPEKIQYLEHDQHRNCGISAARNLGLRHATGDYVAFLDGDDVWLPYKLKQQIDILDALPEAGALCGATEYWYSWSGAIQDQAHDTVVQLGVPDERLDHIIGTIELFTCLYPCGQGAAPSMSNLMLRAHVLEYVGGFEEAFRGMYEDQAFLVKLYLNTPMYIASTVWDRYRQHPQSCVATTVANGQYEQIRAYFFDWFVQYLSQTPSVDTQIWRMVSQALIAQQDEWRQLLEERHQQVLEQQSWIKELERGKAWLEEQWTVWHTIAGERERVVQEQQAWIGELERGKAWLEKQWNQATHAREASDSFAGVALYRLGRDIKKYIKRPLDRFLSRHWDTPTDSEHRYTLPSDEQPAQIDEAAIAVHVPASSTQPNRDSSSLQDDFTPQALPASAPSDATPSIQPTITETIDFGSLRRLTPFCMEWGFSRGVPIDRYYIEQFLSRHASDIQGRVLEIGDNSYTYRFGGGRVGQSDVLHVTADHPGATFVGDLTAADHIPSDAFDCVILTQTLHLIYDLPAALRTLHRILKPKGVLLASFPGITRISYREWPGSWYWSLTNHSTRKLFEQVFQPTNVQVASYGNVLAAAAFLYGIAAAELRQDELEHRDPEYEVLLTARATKQEIVVKDSPKSEWANQVTRGTASVKTGNHSFVLLYHRVAQTADQDPWLLSVTATHFAEQMEVLRKRTAPVSLQALVEGLQEDTLPRQAVAVTFDDGYADNLYCAKPALETQDIPATIFLPTHWIGQTREFWWDELERVLLQPGKLPDSLRLMVGGEQFEWTLGTAADYSEAAFQRHCRWSPWHDHPTQRQAIYRQLWELLHSLPTDEQLLLSDQILEWAQVPAEARATHRTLSHEEVTTLANHHLIEFGSHTCTHPMLSRLSVPEQWQEVHASKLELETVLSCSVQSFAYPFGKKEDYTRETTEIVRGLGHTCAFTNFSGLISRHSDRFQLPRFHVQDWDGDEFTKHLLDWIST